MKAQASLQHPGVTPTHVLLCTLKHYPQTPLIWSLPSLPGSGKQESWCSCTGEMDPSLPGTSRGPSFKTSLRAVTLDGAQKPQHH